MDNEKLRVLSRSGNIFFNISIAAIILCCLGPLVFAYDIISFLGKGVLISICSAIWIVLALLGVIIALLAIDEYRSFIGQFGRFIISLFGEEGTDKIMTVIMNIADYYWILVVIAAFSVVCFFTFKGITRELTKSKSKVIVESILTVICIICATISFVLIGRLKGGVA